LKINTNFASPNEGVISMDNNTGIIKIGSGSYNSIGVNIFNSAMLIGDGLLDIAPPIDPVNPVKWVRVIDSSGNFYSVAAYQ
jgi:hypothetical protein